MAISPLNFYMWFMFLCSSGYADADWVLNGIRHGFSLGLVEGPLKSALRNCSSAYDQPDLIDSYLDEEIRFGAIAGPFLVPPLDNLHINRFGVIPKSTSVKFRLIRDLSFPQSLSVNSLIPDSEADVSYAGIPKAITIIMRLGQGTLLAKFDIRRAYRSLPICKDHLPYLGMRWRGKYYVDLALPFGLRSAPRIFTRFADSLQFLFTNVGGVSHIQHYLDDFFLAGPAGSQLCEQNLHRWVSLCEELGVPLADDKTEGPSTSITYLGFVLDTVKQELRLPPEKLSKVRSQLSLLAGEEIRH